MIDPKKVSIFKKYGGDIDGWARIGTPEEKSIMSDDDWFLIDRLIQDVIVARNNLILQLKKEVDSVDAINEILNLANNFSQGEGWD